MRTPFKKICLLISAVVGITLAVFGVEILLALPGPDDHFHNPRRLPMRFGGMGKPRVYVVMGDSTAAGRGGDYDRGIAVGTARYLAQNHPVELVNLGISGARIRDVVIEQLPVATRLKPDIVLLAVGANDATHFTSGRELRDDLETILRRLSRSNPQVRCVLTGSPDVGTVPRFAQPLRWLAGVRSDQVNAVLEPTGRERGAVWAPIARVTGPLFAQDRSLFAPDRFHPNDRGYATWLPVLDAALDRALRSLHPGR